MQKKLNLRHNKSELKAFIYLHKEEIVNALIIVLTASFLFILSLYTKNAFNEWYFKQKGIGFYYYPDPSDSKNVWYVEAYSDASYYYIPYLYSFRYQNWNPYSGGKGPLDGYAYGPLFIYGMYFISLFVSLFNPTYTHDKVVVKSIQWTHIVFDSLSVVVLYFIIINVKTLKKKKYFKHFVGLVTGIIYICVPVNLVYIDALSLNIPQMTFFTLLAILMFNKEKYTVSAFFFTLAWLSKQMPLFLVPPLFLILWKKRDGGGLYIAIMKFLLPFILMSILFSLPWLILTPYAYIVKLFAPGKPLDFVFLSSKYNGYTVTLANSFLQLGSESLANIYLWLNKYMIPFFIFYITALLIAYFNGKELSNNESQLFIYLTIVVLITHVFISRGIYKYYDGFISPFYIITLSVFFSELSSNIRNISKITSEILTSSYIIFSSIILYYVNFIIIIKSRFLHPFYLLLIFILFAVMLNNNYYQSLFKKENYAMIIRDFKIIVKTVFHRKKKERNDEDNVDS